MYVDNYDTTSRGVLIKFWPEINIHLYTPIYIQTIYS